VLNGNALVKQVMDCRINSHLAEVNRDCVRPLTTVEASQIRDKVLKDKDGTILDMLGAGLKASHLSLLGQQCKKVLKTT